MPQVILNFIAEHHIPVSPSEARAIWITHRGCVWKTLNSLRTYESNSRFVYQAQAEQIIRLKEAERKQAAEAATQAAFRNTLNNPRNARVKRNIQSMLND